jgi:hypothetical protein
MSINYQIDVDKEAVADAVSLFEFVGGNTSDALRVAINKTAPKVKTLASRAIRDQVRLSASYVGERLVVTKATRSRLSGAIKTPSRGLLLSRFSTDPLIAGDKASWIRPPVIPTNGIRIKIKPDGSTKGAPGVGSNKPFYIVLNGGQNVGIAARTGAGRKGIKVFSGPSLSQVFDTVRGDVLPAASSEYQAQLLDAMRYLLVKKYPPEAVT